MSKLPPLRDAPPLGMNRRELRHRRRRGGNPEYVAPDDTAAMHIGPPRWDIDRGGAWPAKQPFHGRERRAAGLKRRFVPWLARGCAIVLGAATASCVMFQYATTEEPYSDDSLLARMTSQFPDCELEIRAFADTARLARRYGPDGWFFEPALMELEQDIVDCAIETEGYPVSIARPRARQ